MEASFHDQAALCFAAPVTTPRLIIRPWQDGDEKTVAAFLNADGGSFPRRYHHYVYNVIGPFDDARVRDEVFPAIRKLQERRPLFELYIRSRTDNRIIGMIDFSRDSLNRDRVGYFVLPSERQRGYAFEAYAACVDRAVSAGLLTDTLYAHTDPENAISQKFLAKAGFQILGTQITQDKSGEKNTVVAFSRALSKDKPMAPT